ncbi:hypothetical protein [Myxococcus landrumensis]|nr:hypothetical protein [Myxococcus landrumus]
MLFAFKKSDNAAAVQMGRSKSYPLSEVFRNTYASGNIRIYD